MAKILANDGIAENGKKIIEDAGIEVDTNNIPQDQLPDKLNDYDGIIVRSATKVRKDLIDACPNLKFIGRAGVGLDNIDVEYAEEKGVKVANTPAASSLSVAELVFSHLAGMVRFLPESNRKMPENGTDEFKTLKKQYSKGTELRGKTLGLIGFGRIGQETARIAIGMGMHVIPFDVIDRVVDIKVPIHPSFKVDAPSVRLETVDKGTVLQHSDFVSLHTPFIPEQGPVITSVEFNQMKDGAGIVNCARGGVIKEDDLLSALDSGKISAAGVDVFEEEPTNNKALLSHPKVSLTPHIGASTVEGQSRVAEEMAQSVVDYFKK